MNLPEDGAMYGKTGLLGRDGVLTPEQQATLDDIQADCASRFFQHLDQRQPGDLFPEAAMATGIGKGNIIHRVIEEQIRRKPDSRVLIVAGTKIVLVKQTHEALAGYQSKLSAVGTNGFEYIESEEDDQLTEETTFVDSDVLENKTSFLYKTGKIRQSDANVHIATIQTVQSEMKKGWITPEDYDLVIVDEVHNIGTAARKAALDPFRNVIGLTATPYRHSGRMKTPEQYGFTIIGSLPLPDAQNLRLLPPLVGMQIDTKDLVDDIPTTKTGQIDFRGLEKLLKKSPDLRPYIADRVAEIITGEGRNYKTVIAVNFVWEAQELAKLLYDKGIKVGIAVNNQAAKDIHTDEIPALKSIERYKLPESNEDSIQVLISPYVASEGFDAPFTEVLVWASPTDSPLRYTQYTGRLARRFPGKAFGIVVDFLYQTNKYRWSYNMGMWMKGGVRQLDSGLLYLGPETDIDHLKLLPQIRILEVRTDKIDVEDVRSEDFLEIQDDDFPLNVDALKIFVGGLNFQHEKVHFALDRLKAMYPDRFVLRKNNHRNVEVFEGRNLFIEEVLELGFELRDIGLLGIQEGEFPLSPVGFQIFEGAVRSFYGKDKLKAGIIQELLLELKELYPHSFLKRRSGNKVVEAFTDRTLFIQKMLERGFKLQEELLEVQDSDFQLNIEGFEIFARNRELVVELNRASKLLKEELKKVNSSLFVGRKSGNRVVQVCTDKSLFIQEMRARGYKLKEE